MIATQTMPTLERPVQPRPKPAGRGLLLNIGRVGDTILRNSILEPSFRTYETVDYVCGPHNEELVRSDARLNRVIVFRNSPGSYLGLTRAILSGLYDGFIDLKSHASSTSLLLATLFRSRVKTGCNRDGYRPFHRDVRTIISRSDHLMDTMRRMGRLAGLTDGDYKPSVVLPPEDVAWFRKNYPAFNQPFIFLNVSATHPHRVWPPEKWAAYVRGCGLATQPILINGLPKDRDMVLRLCGELPGTVPFEPRGFMHVVAAINAAQLVMTVDTGVVHACSALDKPLVALYRDSVTEYASLSSWRLIIKPPAGRNVPDLDPAQAIADTRRHGLPQPFEVSGARLMP